jgi:serine/threonine protein kinase
MSVALGQLARTITDYTFDGSKPLGQGQFGTVYKAIDNRTNEVVAVKFLRNEVLAEQQAAFMRELGILAENQHPAALRLLGFSLSPAEGRMEQGPIIITPIMPNGTMGDAIKAEGAGRSLPDWNATSKSKCVFGMAVGMAYVHSKEVLHRDLKPDNVFLGPNYEPVIADFGISKNCAGDISRTMGTVGSPLFMAPEIFLDEEAPPGAVPVAAYGPAVDVYSFAMLLYIMFYPKEQPKFEGGRVTRSSQQLMMQVGKGTRYERPKNVPDYYWDLIKRCWDHAPEKRPTFQMLVDEFQTDHNYVLEGADRAEVARYERAIILGGQKEEDRKLCQDLDDLLAGVAPPPVVNLGASFTGSMRSSLGGLGKSTRRKFV